MQDHDSLLQLAWPCVESTSCWPSARTSLRLAARAPIAAGTPHWQGLRRALSISLIVVYCAGLVGCGVFAFTGQGLPAKRLAGGTGGNGFGRRRCRRGIRRCHRPWVSGTPLAPRICPASVRLDLTRKQLAVEVWRG